MASSVPCSRLQILGCILIGVTGIPFTIMPLLGSPLDSTMLALGMYIAGAASIALGVRDERRLIASLGLLGLGLASFAIQHSLWPILVALTIIASAIAATSNPAAGVAGLATTLAMTLEFSPYSYKWLLTSLYIALLGAASVAITRRVHALILGAASLVPLVEPGLPSLVAAVGTLFIFIYIMEVRQGKSCIFAIDQPTIALGAIVTLAGIALLLAQDSIYGRALAAGGLVVLSTAFLKPVGIAPGQPEHCEAQQITAGQPEARSTGRT